MDVKQAAAYADKHLGQHQRGRLWLTLFWGEETPEGRAAVRHLGNLSAAAVEAESNDALFVGAVKDVQRVVFGDAGDAAVGAAPAPATPDEVDGLCGPETIKRVAAYMTGKRAALPGAHPAVAPGTSYILFAGERLPVSGVDVIALDAPGGLDLMAEQARHWKKAKGATRWPKPISEVLASSATHATHLATLHWDAGWSAEGAFRTLVNRGLGTCFGVDRPDKSGRVVVYQWLDPGLYYGWHAGTEANRRALASFDLSNAVYLKFAPRYAALCHAPRPVVCLPGSSAKHLGMYEGQIVSTLRVLAALSKASGRPLVFPTLADGEPRGRNWKGLFTSGYAGAFTHEHLPQTTKWDIRAFSWSICALLLTRPQLMLEFPSLVECFRLEDAAWRGRLEQMQREWTWPELWPARNGG